MNEAGEKSGSLSSVQLGKYVVRPGDYITGREDPSDLSSSFRDTVTMIAAWGKITYVYMKSTDHLKFRSDLGKHLHIDTHVPKRSEAVARLK